MKPSHAFQAGEAFAKSYPKAIDFPQAEYEREKTEFDRIAAEYGYRLAGFRLQRAVFTTKTLQEDES